jgi:hypothetical protein
VLVECAWAASVKKNCFLHDRFGRLAGAGNRKRALMAIAHSLLGLIYTALTSRQPYEEKARSNLMKQSDSASFGTLQSLLAQLHSRMNIVWGG